MWTQCKSQYSKFEIIPCILSEYQGRKLDINNRYKKKLTDSWKLNHSLLNEKCVKIKKKKTDIKDFLECNANDYITYPNLWDTVQVVLGGKLIALNMYIFKKIRDSGSGGKCL